MERQHIGRLIVAVLVSFTLGMVMEANISAQRTRSGYSFEAESCYVKYARFATESYRRFERCMIDTARFVTPGARAWCGLEYTSNALQAAADYTSCMSLGRLWP